MSKQGAELSRRLGKEEGSTGRWRFTILFTGLRLFLRRALHPIYDCMNYGGRQFLFLEVAAAVWDGAERDLIEY